MDYVAKHIGERREGITISPLSWFQSSYLQGQFVDLLTQCNELFYSSAITQMLWERVNFELKNGDEMGAEMQRRLRESQGMMKMGKEILPGHLGERQCDREILAYSRYVLQLAACSSFTFSRMANKGLKLDKKKSEVEMKTDEMMRTVLDLIVHRLSKLISEELDCETKSSIVESISINIWKTVRILQTKKDEVLFTDVICRYM
jgi:hypothetical protein